MNDTLKPCPDSIHSCSYYCHRPDCIKEQRDALRDAVYFVDNSELIALLNEDLRIIKKYMLDRHSDVFGGLVGRLEKAIAALSRTDADGVAFCPECGTCKALKEYPK